MTGIGGWREALRAGRLLVAHPAAGSALAGVLPPLAADVGLRSDAVLAVPTSGQVVFRLLGRSVAREWDFQSARDRERPPRPGQDFLDYAGVSVFGCEDAAIRTARRYPKLLARLHLPAGEGFMIARTLPDAAEHFSVWGDPRSLQRRVVSVVRVDEPD